MRIYGRPTSCSDHSKHRLAMEILLRHHPRHGEDDLREFTWYHLMRRCDTANRTLRGHQRDVYSAEFSPRGDLLASAGKDGKVMIWNTADWQIVRKIAASPSEVNVAVFSPDGKSLATVDDDGTLMLWETAGGKKIYEKQAHKGEAIAARFTPDGKTIVTAGRKTGSSGSGIETAATEWVNIVAMAHALPGWCSPCDLRKR